MENIYFYLSWALWGAVWFVVGRTCGAMWMEHRIYKELERWDGELVRIRKLEKAGGL